MRRDLDSIDHKLVQIQEALNETKMSNLDRIALQGYLERLKLKRDIVRALVECQ